MLKRQERNKENAPTKAGKQKAGEADEVRHGRLRRLTSGLLGKGNENESNVAPVRQEARAALADVKNAAAKDGKADDKGEKEKISISLITKKIRRSLSASPKRSRAKSQEEKQKSRVSLRKGLAEFVPRITAGGMHLRPRRTSAAGKAAGASFAARKEKPKLQKSLSAEADLVTRDQGMQDEKKAVVEEQPTAKEQLDTEKHEQKSKFDEVVIYCEEYAEDTWQYMLDVESRNEISANFLAGSRVTPKMRMVTLDWLTCIANTFQLLPETQLTIVYLFDRYLMVHRFTVDKKQIQLIGLGCAIIASKYEEIYPPDVSDYASLYGCTNEDVLLAEKNVLLSLNYEIGEPRAIHFVRRFTKHFELGVHQLAKAICEIAAYDYNICHVKPSMIAFASVYLAAALKKIEFPEQLYTTAKFSKTKVEKLVPTLANAVVDMLKNQKQYPHIYKKMLVHRELIFSANNIAALTAAANASRPHEEY